MKTARGVLAAYFSVKALEDPAVHAEAEAADSKKRWGRWGFGGRMVGSREFMGDSWGKICI